MFSGDDRLTDLSHPAFWIFSSFAFSSQGGSEGPQGEGHGKAWKYGT
jgi:hypothetical protein